VVSIKDDFIFPISANALLSSRSCLEAEAAGSVGWASARAVASVHFREPPLPAHAFPFCCRLWYSWSIYISPFAAILLARIVVIVPSPPVTLAL
jgi:hypothetical protein